MLPTPQQFVCIWKHTFPLIYRCTGLRNKYSTLQHAPPRPIDWLSMRSSPSHRCSSPSGRAHRRWSNLAGRFSLGTHPGALVPMFSLHVRTLSPNSLPLLFVPDGDPPLDFLPLDLLISAGLGTKSHLGETTCQLRWVFTQKKLLLLNICLQGSKTSLLSPLNHCFIPFFFSPSIR